MTYKQSVDEFIKNTGLHPITYEWVYHWLFVTPIGDFFTWVEAVNSMYEPPSNKPLKKALRKMNAN